MVFTAPNGRKIVCGSKQDFEEIRKQYFPDVPASEWKQQSDTNQQHKDKE